VKRLVIPRAITFGHNHLTGAVLIELAGTITSSGEWGKGLSGTTVLTVVLQFVGYGYAKDYRLTSLQINLHLSPGTVLRSIIEQIFYFG